MNYANLNRWTSGLKSRLDWARNDTHGTFENVKGFKGSIKEAGKGRDMTLFDIADDATDKAAAWDSVMFPLRIDKANGTLVALRWITLHDDPKAKVRCQLFELHASTASWTDIMYQVERVSPVLNCRYETYEKAINGVGYALMVMAEKGWKKHDVVLPR